MYDEDIDDLDDDLDNCLEECGELFIDGEKIFLSRVLKYGGDDEVIELDIYNDICFTPLHI